MILTPCRGLRNFPGQLVQGTPRRAKDERHGEDSPRPRLHRPARERSGISFTASSTEKSGDVNTAIVDIAGRASRIRWVCPIPERADYSQTYKSLGRAAPPTVKPRSRTGVPWTDSTFHSIAPKKQGGQDSVPRSNRKFRAESRRSTPRCSRKPAAPPQQ